MFIRDKDKHFEKTHNVLFTFFIVRLIRKAPRLKLGEGEAAADLPAQGGQKGGCIHFRFLQTGHRP